MYSLPPRSSMTNSPTALSKSQASCGSSWWNDLELAGIGIERDAPRSCKRLSPGRAPLVFQSAPPQSYSGAGFAVPQYTVFVFGS